MTKDNILFFKTTQVITIFIFIVNYYHVQLIFDCHQNFTLVPEKILKLSNSAKIVVTVDLNKV